MTSLRFSRHHYSALLHSRDPTESTKHDRAVALVDAGNNALSVQGLGPNVVALQGAENFRADHDRRIGD